MAGRTSSLRADAARNRELILDAARGAFAQHGLDVSLREIARRAGVSEPTLRRRFTSKEQLVAEAFEDKVQVYADLALAALEDPDPGAGLRRFLHQMLDMQLVDRGFADVLTMTFPRTMRCEQTRRSAYDAIERLIAKAKDAGAVRGDFVAEDIVLLLLTHAGVASGAGSVTKAFSARLQALLFQALGLTTASVLPRAPSAARVYRALMRLHDPQER